jgi:hypothetical protein
MHMLPLLMKRGIKMFEIVHPRNKVERKNRTWVVMMKGVTGEEDKSFEHNQRMVKFELPENYKVPGIKCESNSKLNAACFFNNVLENDEYLTDDNIEYLIFNDRDVYFDLDMIPYFETFFGTKRREAKTSTYAELGIYGH